MNEVIYTKEEQEKIKAMVQFYTEVVKPLVQADDRWGRVLDIRTGKELKLKKSKGRAA
jgi:hypothetical protein